MTDLSLEELDRLYEGSKDDRYIIVGSEVRQMVGMIRRLADRIEALEAALERIVQWAEDYPIDALSLKVIGAVARAALDKEARK